MQLNLWTWGGGTGTAARYDPRMSGWETMRGMGSKRGAPGCCVVDGQIYIVGGSDGSDMLSTCEVYEPRTNSWRTVCPLL